MNAIWLTALSLFVGVLVAIPLSILANILTPRVNAWWATTSAGRRTRRIGKLNKSLEYVRENMKDNNRQEALISGLRFCIYALFPASYVALTMFLLLMRLYTGVTGITPTILFWFRHPQPPPSLTPEVGINIMIAMILGLLVFVIVLLNLARERFRAASYRYWLKQEIDILQELSNLNA